MEGKEGGDGREAEWSRWGAETMTECDRRSQRVPGVVSERWEVEVQREQEVDVDRLSITSTSHTRLSSSSYHPLQLLGHPTKQLDAPPVPSPSPNLDLRHRFPLPTRHAVSQLLGTLSWFVYDRADDFSSACAAHEECGRRD